MDGWIKLHRRLLENPVVCKDADYLAVWVYLLLTATHNETPVIFQGQKIMLKPGQLITGRMKIANDLKINDSKVKRILDHFKTDQQIAQQTSNKNSLITVLNWGSYQKSDQQNDQQMNNKRTASEQQVNTNKNIKNEKNEKNERIKERYGCNFEAFWKTYPRKKEKARAYEKYQARLNSGFSEAQLLEAAEKYAKECERENTPQKYIKLAATFLSASTPFVDYLGGEGYENDLRGNDKTDTKGLVEQALEAGVAPTFDGFDDY